MLRKWRGALAGLLAVAGVLGILAAHVAPGSQAAPLPAAVSAGANLPPQEVGSDAAAPDISTIDSPSPTCHRPVAGTGACYIQWEYLYVTASSGAYVISMTVTIDNRLRAYHSGFFQTAMYIPGDMLESGYRVSCGAPGSGTVPETGRTYSYAIRARESTGLTTANYGSVTCPADLARVLLPLIRKP